MVVPSLLIEHFLKACFLLFLYFFKDNFWVLQKYVIMEKHQTFYIFRRRITTLSMSVLAISLLMFIQLLSTLDAWVGSDTRMTLFIPTQPSWRETASSGWSDTLFPVPSEPSAYSGGRGGWALRFLRVPREWFFKLSLYKILLVFFHQSSLM